MAVWTHKNYFKTDFKVIATFAARSALQDHTLKKY